MEPFVIDEAGYGPVAVPSLVLLVFLAGLGFFLQGGARSNELLRTRQGCVGVLALPIAGVLAVGFFVLSFDEFLRLEMDDDEMRIVYLLPRGATTVRLAEVRAFRAVRVEREGSDPVWFVEIDVQDGERVERHLSRQTARVERVRRAAETFTARSGKPVRWTTPLQSTSRGGPTLARPQVPPDR
jgi:hypothetical protein